MEELTFQSLVEFRAWLVKNHSQSTGIWLRIFKKDSGISTITYAEALDQALCFGWIDGQKKPCDAKSWLQKLTPRRSKSNWSRRNTELVERLIKSGEMMPPGLEEMAKAKADGRWQAAYDSFGKASIPEDFLKDLAANKTALACFETLNKTNRYSIAYRLQTAKKPETREKRKRDIIAMLARGEKFH